MKTIEKSNWGNAGIVFGVLTGLSLIVFVAVSGMTSNKTYDTAIRWLIITALIVVMCLIIMIVLFAIDTFVCKSNIKTYIANYNLNDYLVKSSSSDATFQVGGCSFDAKWENDKSRLVFGPIVIKSSDTVRRICDLANTP